MLKSPGETKNDVFIPWTAVMSGAPSVTFLIATVCRSGLPLIVNTSGSASRLAVPITVVMPAKALVEIPRVAGAASVPPALSPSSLRVTVTFPALLAGMVPTTLPVRNAVTVAFPLAIWPPAAA